MADTCEVVVTEHNLDRRVTKFRPCGQPASHRYGDGQHVWVTCVQHADPAWETLEEEQPDGADTVL